MSYKLSEGAFSVIMNGGQVPEPVVQVLSLKKMNTGSGEPEKDRYRAFLSDGKYTISFAMMTAPVYAKAGEDGIPKFSIVRILRYITSVINNTGGKGDSRVLLVLDLQLLANGNEVGDKIGNPRPYTESSSSAEAKTQNISHNVSSGSDPPAAKIPKLMPSTITNKNDRASTSHAGHITHPISSLSPYHNKWVIKVKVTNKGPIRTWSNSRGEGKLFSMDLMDESGEIRCTAFKEQVDKFYDLIQVDKVYYISKCQLKPANKQFNVLKNDYEMTMASETIVEECHEEDIFNMPEIQFRFIPISKVTELEPNNFVDIIGVVKCTSEVQTFQAKSTGRELKKRDVMLVDQSNTSITLTLWGAEAENFDGSSNPVVALRGAKISEFGGGISLSTISGTLLRINPDLKECYRLKGWYESEGSRSETTNLSAMSSMADSFSTPFMSFQEALDKQLGHSEKGDYYRVKATVLLVRSENVLYKACPSEECKKKVIDNDNGMYKCEKCNREYPNFQYRFLCSMNIGDWSGNQWVSMFNSEAEKVINMTAEEAGRLQENDKPRFTAELEKAHFKEFIFKCRVKMETYSDEQRLKTVVVKVDPVNHTEYNSYLINSINQLMSGI